MRHESREMFESEAAHSTLDYATPIAVPTGHSGYAVASVIVASISLLWWPLGMFVNIPFDGPKQDRIGSAAAVLALILAFAAYRQFDRKHALAKLGAVMGALALALYMLLPSL